MLLMMSENITRNMYSSQGTINYPTQLHHFGHFRKFYHVARNHECQVALLVKSFYLPLLERIVLHQLSYCSE